MPDLIIAINFKLYQFRYIFTVIHAGASENTLVFFKSSDKDNIEAPKTQT